MAFWRNLRDDCAAMTDPNFKPATPDDIEALLTMIGRVFLITMGGEITGYAVLTFGYSLEFRGRDAFVDELYLRDEYRGRGIGKRALEFLAGVCADNGVCAMRLEVERSNTRAQSVYRKFGFEDHDRYLMTKWLR
jgi:ribosomal protein S18 acetylase RimI-like enzyme